MSDDGDTKDDVKMPDGEIGDKINKLFKVDEKDTSMSPWARAAIPPDLEETKLTRAPQTLLSLLPWARRRLSKPRKPPSRVKAPYRLDVYVGGQRPCGAQGNLVGSLGSL